MKRWCGLAAALWLLATFSGASIETRHDRLFARPLQDRAAGDVMLDALGGFRTVLARYLWFKMDLFHEVMESQGTRSDKEVELMPLLRMISLLDPTITDAFEVISWDLYKGHGDKRGALEILDEGIKLNPQSVSMLLRQSLILYQDKQYGRALASARKAEGLATDRYDVLNAQRLVRQSKKKLELESSQPSKP